MSGITELALLGAIAGFTIYLGLPIAGLGGVSRRAKGFLTAMSVGVLLFLLIEISHTVFEAGEDAVKDYLASKVTLDLLGPTAVAIVGGLALGLLGLVWFEQRFILRGSGAGADPSKRAGQLALMMAIGIGLHNFSEGLAIGQSQASGALHFAILLTIGFALHNATEGFGIAAPLAGHRVSVMRLLALGMIAGGPTFIGTMVGGLYTAPILGILFLSLAAGAIVYVIKELLYHGRVEGEGMVLMSGLLLGLLAAYGTDVILGLAGA